MKTYISAITFLFLVGLSMSSFKKQPSKQRIYPEIQAFFKSLNVTKYDKQHFETLENIKYHINTSNLDTEDWNIIFYCSENTFRSQAAQIFAQTLCYANKLKKVKIYSAGYTTGEINPTLISFLKKVGYKVSEEAENTHNVYKIRYSDDADPIILFSKTLTDQSLPVKDITSVIVCDTLKEQNCSKLQTATYRFNLPFEKLKDTDSDELIGATLTSIATEMVYVTTKK